MKKIRFHTSTLNNYPFINNQHQPSTKENMTSQKIDRVLAEFDELPASAHVRLPTVIKLFGVSRPTIYRWIRDKKVPAPKHFSERASCWNVGELRIILNKKSQP